MKYIRTKDGRIIKHPRPNFIEKLDNSIEELCDEFLFVLDHNDLGKLTEHILIKKENLEYFKLLTRDIQNSILYGAIWTDKGLIYVAKMNDKGELELL